MEIIAVVEVVEKGFKIGRIRNPVISFNAMIEDELKKGFHLGNTYQKHSTPQYLIHPS
jgi:hypothetical protein